MTPILPLQQGFCWPPLWGWTTPRETDTIKKNQGFDFLSQKEREDALKEFPGLYRAVKNGSPVLHIKGGSLSMDGINEAFYGSHSQPDWKSLEEIPLWKKKQMVWLKPAGFCLRLPWIDARKIRQQTKIVMLEKNSGKDNLKASLFPKQYGFWIY